jgi:hypothetical protein
MTPLEKFVKFDKLDMCKMTKETASPNLVTVTQTVAEILEKMCFSSPPFGGL